MSISLSKLTWKLFHGHLNTSLFENYTWDSQGNVQLHSKRMIYYYPTSWRLFKAFPLGFVTSLSSRYLELAKEILQNSTWLEQTLECLTIKGFRGSDYSADGSNSPISWEWPPFLEKDQQIVQEHRVLLPTPQPGPKVTFSSDQTQGNITKVLPFLTLRDENQQHGPSHCSWAASATGACSVGFGFAVK